MSYDIQELKSTLDINFASLNEKQKVIYNKVVYDAFNKKKSVYILFMVMVGLENFFCMKQLF